MKTFILIVGCPRSGTTLIRNMLNAHPDIYIFPQSQFFNKIWGSRRLIGYKKNREKLLSIISQDRAVMRAELDMFSGHNLSRRTFDDYYDEYIKIIEENNTLEKKILGDKTPRHIFFLTKIKRHIKLNIKTVVAIRDSRAVVASQKKRGMVKSVEQGAAIWNFFLERIIMLLKMFPKEEILSIRYEDLVSDPEKTTRKLSAFLNHEYSEHMLNIDESNSSYTDKPQKGIYKDSIYQWQAELSNAETDVITQLTKNYLTYFDYHVSASDKSVTLKSRLNYYFYQMTEHAIISLMNFGIFPTYSLTNLKKIFSQSNVKKQ